MTIALTVLGASGKMGRRVMELAHQDPTFRAVSGMTRLDTEPAFVNCDVAIDFSSHEATPRHLKAALAAGKPLVIGTTGHSAEGNKAIEEAAKTIPILFSPNFSFGIALCLEAAARFGKALYGTCRIEIVESHHVHKKDSPSGTALALAHAVKGDNDQEVVIRSIRTGDVVGEHIVIFECGHERIELKHTTHSRDAFAQGALLGAKFLASKPAGLYALKDVFN